MAGRTRQHSGESEQRPIRVAQICGAVDGGQWMVELAAGLHERGYEVVAIIAGAHGDTAARLEQAGVPFEATTQNLCSTSRLAAALSRVPRVGRALRRPIDAVALLASCVRMARILRRLEVEITHTHIFNAILIGRFAGAFARVPIRIAMVPGPYHLEAPFTRRIDLLTQRLDRCLVGGSQYTDDLYAEFGVPARRHRCIPYGADPAVFDPGRADPGRIRREFGVLDSTPLIGQVAHFYPVVRGPLAPPGLDGRGLKGHEEFVTAASIVLEVHPDARFLLVGADWESRGAEHRREIQELVKRLGLEHAVVFTGQRSDVVDILAALDVSVQCSLSENYGGTIESLLMRAPTIATRVGGMPETVRHEETGLLIPAGDSDALAAAMLRLIDDRPLAAKLGQHGREQMLAHFTTQRTIDGVDALYRELANERGLAGVPSTGR